jgi:quinol-cytochrome oxidoreductase complex cytochrome b subunit
VESVPGQTKETASPFARLGAALLLLALVAVITGLALVPFYRALALEAHRSVAAMERSLPLQVLRASHHWLSALLLVACALYLVYGIATGAYRRPRQWAWVAAVGVFIVCFLFQLTGHLLPWDRHAVSTAVIEIGIAANAPVVGPLQARLLRGGGDAVGPQTLTAWYVAHVALLPLALATLAWIFLRQMHRLGDPPEAPRLPVAVLLLGVLLLAVVAAAPLGPAAGPEDYQSFAAPPEWYVLSLHGLMSLAQRINPSLSFMGSMVVPGLAVLFLVALPWLDRRAPEAPASRRVLAATVVGLAGILALKLMNADHAAPLFTAPDLPAAALPTKETPAADLDAELIRRGTQLTESNGCLGCHRVGGKGGAVGPALDGTGTRRPGVEWQLRHLKNPTSEVPGSTMPPYSQLSEADLKAIATYMASLK